MSSSNRIIVGLDFGTTFTGAAIAWSDDPKDIEVINNWPGSGGLTHEKVPTEFSYHLRPTPDSLPLIKTSNSVIDLTAFPRSAASANVKDVRWGYHIKTGESRIRCIKLFLDRNQKLPPFVDDMALAVQLKQSGRDVIDAAGDFLAKIHSHVLEVVKRRCGDDLAREKTLEFVLTVPAIWSDAAKNATKEAAHRAGIERGSITMISEPEAAAIYALHEQQHCLTVGSNFIVCDAGGGTVDLISYKIKSLAPLAVEENSVGTGGLCGAAFLNYAFEDTLRTLLGESVYAQWRIKYPIAFEHGFKHFEDYVKRDFSDAEGIDFYIPLPGAPDDQIADIKSGFLTLTREQVKHIFEPVVHQILGLIREQISAVQAKGGSVSSIVLVGGFGKSQHLYERIKAEFNNGVSVVTASSKALVLHRPPNSVSYSQKNVAIIQPVHAWSAVVRGAALRGTQGSVATSRRSRYHYGTRCCPTFIESKHPPSSRYYDPYDGSYRANRAMHWYVHKGDTVSERRAISVTMLHRSDKKNHQNRVGLSTTCTLYATAEADAPVIHADTFQEVCSVTADLSTIPLRLYRKMKNPKGRVYYELSFNLEMIIASAELSFSIKVGSRSYGVAEAVFNH